MKIEQKITITSNEVFRILGSAGKAVRLLDWIIANMNPNDYVYSSHITERQYVAKKLGVDPTTINGMLTTLVKYNIIYRYGRGRYRVNKEYINIEYPNFKRERVNIPLAVTDAGKSDKRKKMNKIPNQQINYGAITEELMRTPEQIDNDLDNYTP
jgi:hypothetical protein